MSCCQTQVRAYLQFGRDLHQAGCDLFELLAESPMGAHQSFLNDYLLKQERNLVGVIKDGLKSNSSGVLDSWVDLKPKLDISQLLPPPEDQPNPGRDELSSIVFHYRDVWIGYLEAAISAASDRNARELFQSLHRLEVNERNHLTSAIIQLDDL